MHSVKPGKNSRFILSKNVLLFYFSFYFDVLSFHFLYFRFISARIYFYFKIKNNLFISIFPCYKLNILE
nr:MAG TPA: hypothetical protein [Caudoviricetes sp.]